MSEVLLQDLVKSISDLNETEMSELFKILHLNKCEYTKNNNGIFINLSWQNQSIIETIEKYILFCKQSREEVSKYQSICDVLNKKMDETRDFEKVEKKISHNVRNARVVSTRKIESSVETNGEDTTTGVIVEGDSATGGGMVSKVSSSMKFYLLKKKYAKMAPHEFSISGGEALHRESYLIN
jgi:hypothetical protein